MADDAENIVVDIPVSEDNSAKRKTPEKKEKKKKDTPPPMERRKSSRLLEKPTKKYADDEDKVSDEDFTPSSRSSSRGLKRKTSKGTRAKKAKSEDDDFDGDEKNEDVNHSSSTSSSSLTVNPPSQDGLSKLTNTYNDIQSQDFSLQTYKRNQDYIQPLGKLTKEQVHKGRQVLDELKVLIEAGDVENQKVTDLTNQFYTIVPSQAESLPTIKTKTELEENYHLLESLVG